MRTVTVRNVSRCPGGGHIHGDLYVDGVLRRRLTCDAADVLTAFPGDTEALFALFCRVAVAEAGATTPAQAKTAIESQEWRL